MGAVFFVSALALVIIFIYSNKKSGEKWKLNQSLVIISLILMGFLDVLIQL